MSAARTTPNQPPQENVMGLFHLTICDNVNAIRRWHDKKHLGPWHECYWEPCSETESEFRRVWS